MSASNRIDFFAAKDDLSEILDELESRHALQYVEAGLRDKAETLRYGSYKEVDNFGIAMAGDANLEPFYLVGEREVGFVDREIPQRRGGPKYSFDLMANPHCISLHPGGVFRDKAVLVGKIGASTEHQSSADLFRNLRAAMRRCFGRTKGFFVGLSARALYERGYRLTRAIGAPAEYDLLID